MSKVKRYARMGELVDASPGLLRLYPAMTVYVMASDFDAALAREQALQLRLNAADQRIDDLEELLIEAQRSVDYHAGMQRLGENDRLYDLLRRIKEALPLKCSEAPAKCAQARRTDEVQIKGMIEAIGGKFAIMIDEANVHYGWTFQRHPDGMWVSGRKATEAEMHAARTHAHITNQQSPSPLKVSR